MCERNLHDYSSFKLLFFFLFIWQQSRDFNQITRLKYELANEMKMNVTATGALVFYVNKFSHYKKLNEDKNRGWNGANHMILLIYDHNLLFFWYFRPFLCVCKFAKEFCGCIPLYYIRFMFMVSGCIDRSLTVIQLNLLSERIASSFWQTSVRYGYLIYTFLTQTFFIL